MPLDAGSPYGELSMRQAVNHVVDAEFEGVVRRLDREESGVADLPVLGEVSVVVGNDHQAPGRVIVLVEAEELRCQAVQVMEGGVWDFGPLHTKKRVEDRMAVVERHESGARHNP